MFRFNPRVLPNLKSPKPSPGQAKRSRLKFDTLEDRVTPDATLVSISYFDGALYKFNADSGNVAATLIAPYSGGNADGDATGLAGVTFGPDGDLYISNQSSTASPNKDAILKYDFATGALTQFISTATMNAIAAAVGVPTFGPTDLNFGPDGDLYVGLSGGFGSQNGRVVRIDMNYNTPDEPTYAGTQVAFGTAFEFLPGQFAPAFIQPSSLLFGEGADAGTLYVGTGAGVYKLPNADQIPAGSPAGFPLIPFGTSGLEYASGLTFEPATGNLLVIDLGFNEPNNYGKVLRFTTGGSPAADPELTSPDFVTGNGPLQFEFPSDGLFDDEGRLLTANLGDAYPDTPGGLIGSITRFNADGTLERVLVDSAAFPNTAPGTAGISPSRLALIANQAPALTLPGTTVTFTEGGNAVLIDPAGAVLDGDSPDFDTGTLTVSLAGVTPEDRLQIRNQGNGADQVGVSGFNVSFEGTVVGTFTGGVGTNLVVTFNADSTPEAAQAILRNVTFSNVSDTPPAGPRTVSVAVTDEDGDASTTETNAVAVTAVNDAPVLQVLSASTTVGEGPLTSVFIDETKLAFTDPDGTLEADIEYKLVTVPANGWLDYQGVYLQVGDTFTQLDLVMNGMYYEHGGNEAPTDQFTFTVSDVSNVSEPVTVGPFTFGITVTPVNDAPAEAANTGAVVLQNTTTPITQAQLNYTDVDDAPAAVVYTVTAVPAGGSFLLLNGSQLAVNGTFTQADVNAGLVAYDDNTVVAPDSNSFTFNVTDGDATITGQTFAITVNDVNDAPVAASGMDVEVDEGGEETVTAANLEAVDNDTGTPASQLVFTVTNQPDFGVLLKNDSPLGAGTFTQDDIDNGRIKYKHNGAEIPATDAFAVVVTDGINPNLTPVTVTVGVAPVNDAPAVTTNLGVTVLEGGTIGFATRLAATDADDVVADLTYAVTALPTRGQLRLDGTPLDLGDEFSQADIADGSLTYANGGSEFTSDSFAVTVADPDLAASPAATVNITVLADNDAPDLTTGALAVSENATVFVTAAQLSATDAETPAGQLFYTLTAAPAGGTLRRNGVAIAVSVIGTFTQQDVFDNLITYVHNGSEAPTDGFSVSVSDGSKTDAGSVTVAVSPVNDVPTLASAANVSVTEGLGAAITTANLTATDPDDGPADLIYTVTVGPAHGRLLVSGSEAPTFTQAQLSAGSVQYVHDGSESTADAVTVTVFDGAATSAALTVAITVTPANDAPVAAAKTYAATEDMPLTVPAPGLLTDATDADVPANTLTAAKVTNPSNGTVVVNPNGSFTYTPNANFFGTDTFTFRVNDGAANSAPETVTINVAADNDAPVLTVNGFNVLQNGTATLSPAVLSATDVDNPAGSLTYTASPPTNGTIRVNGVASNTFTQAQVNAGLVTFQHDGSPALTGTFTVSVFDGAATAGPATVTVNVASTPVVTDDPVAAAGFAGTEVTFTAKATGSPAPTVQWQVSTNGGAFTPVVEDLDGTKITTTTVAGTTTSTLKVAAVAGLTAPRQYKAVFTNIAGTDESAAAALTVTTGLNVLTRPVATEAAVNANAVFSASATGSTKTTTQWQVSYDGGATYANIARQTKATLTVKATAANDGALYRAAFTNKSGPGGTAQTGFSPAGKLTTKFTVTTAAKAQTVVVRAGTPVTLIAQTAVRPTGVQWQSSTDKGKTWASVDEDGIVGNIEGEGDTYSFTADANDSKYYRALYAKTVGTARTATVILSVVAPPAAPTVQPTNMTAAVGGTVFTSVSALVPPGGVRPTIQWQVSTDGGKTFSNVTAGVKTTSLTTGVGTGITSKLTLTKVKAALDNTVYRAVFTNTAGLTFSNAVTLDVT